MTYRSPYVVFIVAFGAVFYLVERAGLFGGKSSSHLEILYSKPVLLASVVLFILIGIAAIRNIKRHALKEWSGIIAVVLIVSGLWISYLTRVSFEVVLTEGQTYTSSTDSSIISSLYSGRLAKIPDFSIRLKSLAPEFSKKGNKINKLRGSFIISKKGDDHTKMIIKSGGLPRYISGMLLSIKDFGYSPRYVLKMQNGRILDSAFVYLSLFPHGNEDYFRLLSPLTYYLRYYPKGNEDNGQPVYRLRIARNKDLLVDREVKPDEEVTYENAKISFPEVRRWTKLVIRQDSGEIIAVCGGVLGFLFVLFSALELIRQRQ